MNTRPINAADAPAPKAGYAQAYEVSAVNRWLYISGQIPTEASGQVALDFEGQCRQAWANVQAQLAAAGMTLDNLVKVTTFLADRSHGVANRNIRHEVLGARTPALTVVIVGIFDEAWLVEIEAVAAV
jgi:2-iminobutanoate/2-iminopropanoate deaminase